MEQIAAEALFFLNAEAEKTATKCGNEVEFYFIIKL